MSNSVRPDRWQPSRLLHPWDSLGKNTGVGCHFLLQCMKVKSESEVIQSYPTLSNPMDCSLPGSSIQGIFQARVLEWGAIAFSENVPYLSTIQIWIFPIFIAIPDNPCHMFSLDTSVSVFEREQSNDRESCSWKRGREY